MRLWYADPLSCLYSTFASVLLDRGIDPLTCLGRNCRFDLNVADNPHEEFYRVARSQHGTLADISPGVGFTSQWRSAPNVDALAEALSTHGTVIVAVDNYHLPFRPAHHDVHAAHLLILLDRRDGPTGVEFLVADAQPPAFSGWLAEEDLDAAVFSANPADEQDAFFSNAPIAGRHLTFTTDPIGTIADEELVGSAVRNNVTSWHSETVAGETLLEGRAAIDELLATLEGAAVAPLRSLYTLGWSPQAEAHLFAQFCARRASDTQDFLLRDLARAGRDVALAWTDMRMIGTYPPDRERLPQVVRRHGARLREAYDLAADVSTQWLTQASGHS